MPHAVLVESVSPDVWRLLHFHRPHSVKSSSGPPVSDFLSPCFLLQYVYPHAHLHCTVATLASFRTGHLRNAPLATQRAHTRAWAQALAAEFRSSHASHGPKTFTLSAKQPFLSCAAACLSYANPTGEVAALRSLARRSRDRLGATHPEVPTGTDDFNVPGIIHSTVLRFARAPPAAETARVRRDFESIAATWSDVDVSVARAYLAIEDSAYMHVDRATRVAAVFDLATGDAAGWALAADDRGAAIVSPLEE